MKKIYISLLCAAMISTMSFAQSVADFEDLGLSAESYWNGADGSGSFTSGDYTFVNNFTDWGEYGTSWDGFAYSTMTATTYTTLDDQYNCCVGHGANDSKTFGVFFYNSYANITPTISRKDGASFKLDACYVTNSAYAYTSMKEGDDYAKKFGDDDWFLITATGYLDGVKVGTAEYYLAQNGKISDSWEIFDLSQIGTVDYVEFTLSSSDNGEWGMNTPAYFCLDNFNEPLTIDAVNMVRKEEITANTYDLQGHRVSEDQGFMIRNGKIIMVHNR
ncbi:MAG: DUF4465 domain-containing protein [Bacteroidales bacterium]|nr:DUF4465 domain-containing protein [Bacteroidales bacterium]